MGSILVALFVVGSAIAMLLATNPVVSVFFLIVVFFASATLLLAWGVDYLALLFLVIYVGAIAVLFLFVVMMVDLKPTGAASKRSNVSTICFIGSFVFFPFFVEACLPLSSMPGIENDWFTSVDVVTTMQVFGQVLYTYKFPYLLIGGIILLIAMLGAIVLTTDVVPSHRITVSRSQRRRQSLQSYFVDRTRHSAD